MCLLWSHLTGRIGTSHPCRARLLKLEVSTNGCVFAAEIGQKCCTAGYGRICSQGGRGLDPEPVQITFSHRGQNEAAVLPPVKARHSFALSNVLVIRTRTTKNEKRDPHSGSIWWVGDDGLDAILGSVEAFCDLLVMPPDRFAFLSPAMFVYSLFSRGAYGQTDYLSALRGRGT